MRRAGVVRGSDDVEKEQNDNNQQDGAQSPRGSIAPATGIRKDGKGAEEQQQQNNDDN